MWMVTNSFSWIGLQAPYPDSKGGTRVGFYLYWSCIHWNFFVSALVSYTANSILGFNFYGGNLFNNILLKHSLSDPHAHISRSLQPSINQFWINSLQKYCLQKLKSISLPHRSGSGLLGATANSPQLYILTSVFHQKMILLPVLEICWSPLKLPFFPYQGRSDSYFWKKMDISWVG